jgi:RNA polymerase sigma-70 factor (ECF subfamily)
MPDVDVEELYRRYFPIIREKCARMLRDPAEAQDVAQETFTRLWSERARLRDDAGVASWIYRTSTRLAIDRRRRAARDGDAPPDDDLVTDGVDAAERLASRQLLARLAARVPDDELEVGVLSRVDGLTHGEIAGVVGRSDRTVRRLLDRLEARLAHLREAV